MFKKIIFPLLALTIIVFGISFTTVSAQSETIPDWIKNTFQFYLDDKITDLDLISALEYMINHDIINIPSQNNDNKLKELEAQNKELQKNIDSYYLEKHVMVNESKKLDFEDVGDFYITYESNLNSSYDYSAKEWIIDSEYFEMQIDYLNENFKLPYNVEILLTECNESIAFYSYDLQQITICYEFMDSVFDDFETYLQTDLQNGSITLDDIAQSSLNVIDFVFYHELGHALIDIYDLPVTGLEENAVDQFATMFMLFTEDIENSDIIVGQDILWDVGTWFFIQSEYYEQTNYSDVHNLDIQRFYHISCYAYGQNENYNQILIEMEWLPLERAESCYFEYELMKNSWNTLLSKYYR